MPALPRQPLPNIEIPVTADRPVETPNSPRG
jgi:hypothetical protein